MTRKPPLYRPRLLELVSVQWSDARFDNDYDGPAEGHGGSLATLENVGFFCAMNRERITLASCRDLGDSSVRQLVNMPRKMVIGVRSLEPKEAPPVP